MRLKAVSHRLLEQMRQCGVRKAFFILRKGKWDIPGYYGDGGALEMDIGYLIAGLPHGPAYTLDQGFAFVENAHVAFGYPDILFGPADAFKQALRRLTSSGAPLVLGLYKIYDRKDWDMVEADKSGEGTRAASKIRRYKTEVGRCLCHVDS